MTEAHFSQSETNITLWHCIECHKLTKTLVTIHKSFIKATIGGVWYGIVYILKWIFFSHQSKSETTSKIFHDIPIWCQITAKNTRKFLRPSSKIISYLRQWDTIFFCDGQITIRIKTSFKGLFQISFKRFLRERLEWKKTGRLESEILLNMAWNHPNHNRINY